MIRVAFLLCLIPFVTHAQMLMMGETSEGFVSLFTGRDLGQWEGDPLQWKAERSLLTGASDGKSAASLVLGGREYGDFELRFDLRIKRGAGGVQLRGPGKGPLGVALVVDTSNAQWFVNGSSFAVVSSVKPGEWNEFRITGKGGSFNVVQNEQKASPPVVVGDLAPRGKIALLMPRGAPAEVEFRNIRIKE